MTSTHIKKITTICKLLETTFSIKNIVVYDNYICEITFHNKPTQTIKVYFLLLETWNVLKARFQKLQDSDGICVVCFEKEENKEGYSYTCNTCCEFICVSCVTDNLNTRNEQNCPVCRTSLIAHLKKLKELK
jgi:hypothetical protein